MTSSGQFARATIAYDGTDFLGFQWQAKGRTVQGVLEAALTRVTQAETRVTGAGRTDAGVHAQGQVVGFQAVWKHPLGDLHRALNAVLPEDLAVQQLGEAEPGWHPRFSATRRHYRYTVLNQPVRSPLDRRYAHQVAPPLDLAALNAGAAALIGEQDFASFGQPMVRAVRPTNCEGDEEPVSGGSTVRRVFSAGWQQQDAWFIFDIEGNAFLRGMVRSIVGTLLQVGLGLPGPNASPGHAVRAGGEAGARWPAKRVAAILAGRDRSQAAPPAPACGLCLMKVFYD